MVCKDDWEPRHPQDLIKVREERIAPPWVRPEPADVFLLFCTIVTRQAIADVGVADCATADFVTNATYE